jgi:hypothetical protein
LNFIILLFGLCKLEEVHLLFIKSSNEDSNSSGSNGNGSSNGINANSNQSKYRESYNRQRDRILDIYSNFIQIVNKYFKDINVYKSLVWKQLDDNTVRRDGRDALGPYVEYVIQPFTLETYKAGIVPLFTIIFSWIIIDFKQFVFERTKQRSGQFKLAAQVTNSKGRFAILIGWFEFNLKKVKAVDLINAKKNNLSKFDDPKSSYRFNKKTEIKIQIRYSDRQQHVN